MKGNGPLRGNDGRSGDVPEFLLGGGEMGARMRAHDWSATPLGAPETWPQSLRTVVRILLTSRYQMWMAWGDALSFFCNDAYLPTLGVKQSWALGVSAREVWKEIWPDIGPRIEHVLKTGEATWDEGLLLFLQRSGYAEETYHTFSYSPLSDDRGSIVGMLCVVTEETERIIGERRLSSLRELASNIAGKNTGAEVLAAAERSLSANLKDLPFALIYQFDPDGTARLARATGVERGHPIAPALVTPTDSRTSWPVSELLTAPSVLTVDDLERRFDRVPAGAWPKAPRQAVIAPMAQQGQSTPAGFLVAGINPFRRLDGSYLGFINLVAGQIGAGLANAQAYEEERKRAEALAEIDKAKTTFFSNVSHEFRTPLTLMLSPLEEVLSLPKADLSAESRNLVAVAHRNGIRLLKLVNTLLDFSRLEAGRVTASFEATDLADYTAELASNFRAALDKAGLRLAIDAAQLPQPVYVDRDMWEKIILNLLSNAFKFTFTGEIGVTVKMAADGDHAEVSVHDTGTGIPPGELPHLFERFRRVEGARGRSFEGSGIGLALVQELVHRHGGEIGVRSELGSGSTFTITLPFGTAHLPQDRLGGSRQGVSTRMRAQAYVDEAMGWVDGHVAVDVPQASSPEDLGDEAGAAATDKAVVLLADDNNDMRDYVGRLLAERYQVEVVRDGQAALEAAWRRRPDLILSDVMMPRLDGFGLLQALRNDPNLCDVPVILLSARAGEEAKVEGLDAGADDYLTKPFSARELLARVRANLELARVRSEATATMRELNESLAQRVEAEVGERMKAEEALRHAQKMEAIGQLTGGVAHDFNNLLTIIRSSADLLRRRDLPPERWRRYVDAISDTADRAAKLTNQLLIFSRRHPMKREVFDIARQLENITDMLRTVLGSRIALTLDIAERPLAVEADANQFETVMVNLAANARDAMEGQGTLTVRLARSSVTGPSKSKAATGEFVTVTVTDSGCGIPPDQIDRIFEPFFTTKAVGRGTGLGLSQVYGFMQQSGGDVMVESAIGVGTTIKLNLPISSKPIQTSKDDLITFAVSQARGQVLVVEDNAQVGEFSSQLLRDLGYQTVLASNAEEALQLIEKEPERFDVVFSDVVMPGLDGVALGQHIRSRFPGIPFVLTSGYSHVLNGDANHGFQLLQKPYSVEDLSHVLRRALAGRTVR
jgi:signal transduction histidine kinase